MFVTIGSELNNQLPPRPGLLTLPPLLPPEEPPLLPDEEEDELGL